MTNVEMSCSTQTTDKISHPSMNDTEMSYSTQTTRIVSHPSLNDVEMSCSTQTTDKISQSLLNDTEMSYLIQTTRIVSQLSVNDVEMSCSTLTTDKTSQPPSNDMEMSYLTPTTHIVPQLSLNDTEMSCSTQTTDNSNDAYSHGRSNFTRNHEINANLLQMQEVDLQPDIPAKIRKCSDEIDLQACILDEDMLYYFKHDIPMTGPSKHVLSGDENDEGYTNSLSETLEDKHVIENTDISDLVDYLNNKKSWEDLEKAEPGSMQTWDTGYFSEVEMQEI
ncbi:uncharacterized protein LOC100373544 [Saccoglossus kowalevskii]|uniref:Uncharacterized protein LOC100373544 n=1 Tax=Saccoglossus kowalevskii TaxID=10224 RepID=A0ABM0N163_SACKO|nr:PREDICTED: uncharacterized protein LOC100373544 [Saccoglossus kowalevskii]